MSRRWTAVLIAGLAVVAIARVPLVSGPAAVMLLCWLPGHWVLRAVGGQQTRSPAERTILSVALSISLAPVALNPLWHATCDGRWIAGAFAGGLLAAGLALRWSRREEAPRVSAVDVGTERFFAAPRLVVAAALLVALVTMGTYWPAQVGGGPLPSQIHDYIKHHAVLFCLERSGLPLGNPFFADQAEGPSYYYHFFYLIPATVRSVDPMWSIPLAFGVHAALVGLTTAGLCAVLARRLTGRPEAATLAFLLATVVGGIDIVPLVLLGKWAITLDAWADTMVRIHSLLTQVVWTPQNVQGVLVALLAAERLAATGWWRGWLVLGPLLGASLIGSSVWVSFAVLPGAAIWVLVELLRIRGSAGLAARRGLAAVAVAALMTAIALPSLLGYAEMAGRHGKGLTLEWPHHHANALLGRLAPPGIAANLLDLPWMLAVELGALAIFPLLMSGPQWRRIWGDAGARLLLFGSAVGVAGFVTARSHFTYNDFGQKVMMVVMATGAVLGACVVERFAPRRAHGSASTDPPDDPRWRSRPFGSVGRFLVAALILLGLPVAVFQSPLAAVRRFLPEIGPFSVAAYAPAIRARHEAAVLRFLREQTPRDAVVQADAGEERLDLLQMIERQIGVMPLEQDTHVFTGPAPSLQEQALREVRDVVGRPCLAAERHAVLKRHGVTHVLVGLVERQRWSDLAAFDDEDLFECVMRVGESAIYRLR